MKRSGNTGHGERPDVHEPSSVARAPERVNEVAWHNGKNASATGAKAVRERQARAAASPTPDKEQNR